MRISKENVHSRRTESDQSTTKQRPQGTLRLTFPKSARILKRRHYQEIVRASRRYFGHVVVIDFFLGKETKLGISVPRQFGDAVKRNQFKRYVREVFRHLRSQLISVEMIVLPKKGISLFTYPLVKQDILDFSHEYTKPRAEKSR